MRIREICLTGVYAWMGVCPQDVKQAAWWVLGNLCETPTAVQTVLDLAAGIDSSVTSPVIDALLGLPLPDSAANTCTVVPDDERDPAYDVEFLSAVGIPAEITHVHPLIDSAARDIVVGVAVDEGFAKAAAALASMSTHIPEPAAEAPISRPLLEGCTDPRLLQDTDIVPAPAAPPAGPSDVADTAQASVRFIRNVFVHSASSEGIQQLVRQVATAYAATVQAWAKVVRHPYTQHIPTNHTVDAWMNDHVGLLEMALAENYVGQRNRVQVKQRVRYRVYLATPAPAINLVVGLQRCLYSQHEINRVFAAGTLRYMTRAVATHVVTGQPQQPSFQEIMRSVPAAAVAGSATVFVAGGMLSAEPEELSAAEKAEIRAMPAKLIRVPALDLDTVMHMVDAAAPGPVLEGLGMQILGGLSADRLVGHWRLSHGWWQGVKETGDQGYVRAPALAVTLLAGCPPDSPQQAPATTRDAMLTVQTSTGRQAGPLSWEQLPSAVRFVQAALSTTVRWELARLMVACTSPNTAPEPPHGVTQAFFHRLCAVYQSASTQSGGQADPPVDHTAAVDSGTSPTAEIFGLRIVLMMLLSTYPELRNEVHATAQWLRDMLPTPSPATDTVQS